MKLSGQFEDVSVFTSVVKVRIPSGSVNQLNVDKNENDPDTTVQDAFVRFAFYDGNMNVIGQTIVVLTFDQGHLADGYTPEGNWQP